MDAFSDWFEIRIGLSSRALMFDWPGKVSYDAEVARKVFRGMISPTCPLELNWYGKNKSPDLFSADNGYVFLSLRAHSILQNRGIGGLGFEKAVVHQSDGSVVEYSLLVVPNELKSICFKREVDIIGDAHVLVEAIVDGADSSVADVFAWPAELSIGSAIVSARFVEVARAAKLSNVSFVPIQEMEVHVVDPERWRCPG